MRTVRDSIAPYLNARLQAGEINRLTAREHRYILGLWADVCGDRPLDRLSARDVDRMAQGWHGIAPSTRRVRYATVKAWHRWHVSRGLVPPGLLDELVMPKMVRRPPRAMTARQVAKVIDACDDVRTRALVVWAVQLGLRCCELARLDLNDLDLDANTVRVTGKGGHVRMLPIPCEARQALDAYWCEVGLRPGPVFRNVRTGGPLTAKWITRLIGETFCRAGVKAAAYDGLSAHALRHTMATDLLRSGHANLMQVKAALGHSSVSSTQIYLRAVEADDLSAVMAGRTYVAGA